MKTLASVVATSLAITSPFAAYAQSDRDACYARCDIIARELWQRCGSMGSSIDGEYCWLAAGQEVDACFQDCNAENQQISGRMTSNYRFRPVFLKLIK